MKLYVAAKKKDDAAALREALIAEGHEVTSRWITTDLKYGTGATYTDDERRATAVMDDEDVRAAVDGLVLIAEPEGQNVPGGKHVETGIAIALGRPIFSCHPAILLCQPRRRKPTRPLGTFRFRR